MAAAIDAGLHGHLITIGRDGRPQVSVIRLGRDGDELLVAHLRDGQKLRNIERDDRVAISVEVPGTTDNGLQPWAVFHGTARISAGGGPELLQGLAARFLGPGVKFPPMDDPPPGHIIQVASTGSPMPARGPEIVRSDRRVSGRRVVQPACR